MRSSELNESLSKKRYKGQLTSRATLQLGDTPFDLNTNDTSAKGGDGVFRDDDDDEDIDFGSDDEDNRVEWKEDKEEEDEAGRMAAEAKAL